MGREFEDRLERLNALLHGPTRRTAAAEAQERRARIASLYLAWSLGEAERPDDLDAEGERQWRLMEEYEAAYQRVAARVGSKLRAWRG